jgi:hypothetical protein
MTTSSWPERLSQESTASPVVTPKCAGNWLSRNRASAPSRDVPRLTRCAFARARSNPSQSCSSALSSSWSKVRSRRPACPFVDTDCDCGLLGLGIASVACPVGPRATRQLPRSPFWGRHEASLPTVTARRRGHLGLVLKHVGQRVSTRIPQGKMRWSSPPACKALQAFAVRVTPPLRRSHRLALAFAQDQLAVRSPALAGIMGAARWWTVSMISALSMP